MTPSNDEDRGLLPDEPGDRPNRADVSADDIVRLEGVRHAYRRIDGSLQGYSVLDVDLTARRGEFISIVGPSGCGKSTLLTVVAGINPVVTGSVTIKGQAVTGVRRDVGFVFQRDALLPWRTVLQNVALPLTFRKVPRAEARERARSWLARMGLAAFEDRYPGQLSGGQRKRVSIASTLVYEPEILLMDEPFSALDVQTRDLIENDILHVWQQTQQTVLFVTHDLEEAIAMSDRVVVMSAGPGTIVSDYEVDLHRPRDIMSIKHEADFHQLHRKIWDDLRVEVIKAIGETDEGGNP